MHSWDNIERNRKNAIRTNIVRAVVAVTTLVLIALSAYFMSKPRIINGTINEGDNFNYYTNLGKKQVAITRSGGLRFTGIFTPENGPRLSIDVSSVFSGEVSGSITNTADDNVAQIRGFNGHTFMRANNNFWRAIITGSDWSNLDTTIQILGSHWVQPPASLLGLDAGFDFLPQQFSLLMEKSSAFTEIYLPHDFKGKQGEEALSAKFDGHLRNSYTRPISGTFSLQYLVPNWTRAVITSVGKTAAGWHNYIDLSKKITTNNINYSHCFPQAKCVIKYTEVAAKDSPDESDKTRIPVINVVTINHEARLVGTCQNPNPVPILVEKNAEQTCVVTLLKDNTVPQPMNPKNRPSWDGKLDIEIHSLANQTFPINVHPQLQSDFGRANGLVYQIDPIDWKTTPADSVNLNDLQYTEHASGLNSKLKYTANDTLFDGLFGTFYTQFFASAYHPMIGHKGKDVVVNPAWLSSDDGSHLKDLLNKQSTTVPHGFSLLWIADSPDLARVLQQFVGSQKVKNVTVIFLPDLTHTSS